MRYRVMLLGLAVPALLFAQQPEPSLPRFRAGANLVRVDTYVSTNDAVVTDLTVDDFAVFEDDKPQRIENLELIRARGPLPQAARTNPTNVRDMQQQAADTTRLFTLYFDRYFVTLAGSYHTRKPLIETLDRMIGADDLVGVMTPEIGPTSITYSKKTESIEKAVTDTWFWGAKHRSVELTPQEAAITSCYPEAGPYRGIAAAMIGRLREARTLDGLESLVIHLDGLRPERKFVLIFTEGWPMYRPDPNLSRVIEGGGPMPDPLTADPSTGGIRRTDAPDPSTGEALTMQGCERLRMELSQADDERKFLTLLQRANRANVSFYPVDSRGLLVCDNPECGNMALDNAAMRERQRYLYDMAAQTDGHAIINITNVAGEMQKVFRDIGSYYLLRYYSTNARLDGKFRRIRVEVNRPGVDVKARPGYLAPTEAEARAAGAGEARPPSPNPPPPTVTRALDAIAPARGNLPVRIQAAGARNSIRTIVELDIATSKQPEWMTGGTMRLTFEPEREAAGATTAAAQTVTVALEPGQRSVVVAGGEQPLATGRYAVRAELRARNSRTPIQVSTFATVPADAASVGTGALAARRGPSTGLAYIATADPRFRRTERLRVEVPIAGEGIVGAGRLLTREGQPTPLGVTFSTRTDETTKQQFGMADVTLAPLAAGEYILEMSLTKDAKTEVVSYGFRIVP